MTEEMQVIYALSRAMYISLCDHKGFTPHPEPYLDAGTTRYAEIAVRMLGYDNNTLDMIQEANQNV